MSFRFTLSMTRVQCLNEAVGEWGKDEMNFIGYGVSRKGQPFATGYRSLGSYGSGDVRTTSPLPMLLHQVDLENDGLDVLLYGWLIEQDGGGVRDAAAALDAKFFDDFHARGLELAQSGFPRDCVSFTAFYKTILPLTRDLEAASTRGRNDEVFLPIDFLLRFESDNTLSFSRDLQFERSKNLGHYRVTLRYGYRNEPVLDA
ncbi:MAG: hypothetical protein L6Q99_02595 [Planctomycetes bacterium]|nr:hypothetical protein [Planctomycetota bacterium]